MILVACLKCYVGLRISGDNDEMRNMFGPDSDWYPDKYPCPTAGCDGTAKMVPAVDPAALHEINVHEVGPQEAFAAFNGLGLPPERNCSSEAVRAAFERPVKNVGVRYIKGTHRSVLDWIEFEDGSRVYLGSSAYGATVYRISTPHSYAEAASG